MLPTIGFVAGTALLASARMAEGSVSRWLLGAYVLAFGEIVFVSLALSVATVFTRWALIASVIGLFGLVAATQRVRLPPLRFWWQQERVGDIPGAADARLTEWAPNSEIVMAFTSTGSSKSTCRRTRMSGSSPT